MDSASIYFLHKQDEARDLVKLRELRIHSNI